MIKITLRYKVALELYASLSLFFAIIILLYYSISDRIRESLFFLVVGMIGLFLIGFIFFLRTLILDVDSAKFEGDESNYEPNIVEIKVINKVTLEIISSISNVIIISAIFILGIENSGGGANSEVISIAFIIILLLPLMILLKSLIFDFNLIFMNKKHRENFLSDLVNRKTLVFFAIAILILFSVFASNKMVTSVDNLYEKSISTGEDTISDISSNLYITSIEGERKDISDGPITSLTIYLESMDLDFNFNFIKVKFQDKTNTSTLKYSINADESHFYYEGKMTGKGRSILKKGDEGFIKINLSSTKQELYSYDRGTIQLIMGNGKIISKDIKVPEFKGESRISLYSTK
jgi:archaellin